MPIVSDPLSLLARALDQTSDLIDSLRPDQASLPTPCASWTVATLVSHLLDDMSKFKTAARGESPNWNQPPPDQSPDSWSTAFRTGAASLLDTWRRADLDGTLAPTPAGETPLARKVELQIAELAVHAWDIARATGQSVDLDPKVGTYALDWGKQNLRPEFRGSEESGKAFGLEVSMTADAPVYDQLAGWFGRNPAWTPPG